MARSAYKFTSSTILTAVPNCVLDTYTNHISVMNKTDGDIEVYVSSDTFPIMIIPSGVALSADELQAQGQMSIKNTTGTGGDVYIHFWKKESY